MGRAPAVSPGFGDWKQGHGEGRGREGGVSPHLPIRDWQGWRLAPKSAVGDALGAMASWCDGTPIGRRRVVAYVGGRGGWPLGASTWWGAAPGRDLGRQGDAWGQGGEHRRWRIIFGIEDQERTGEEYGA